MALSEVSICNQALGWVGANLIISLTIEPGEVPSAEKKLCNANYAQLRDAVMEEIDWSFGIKRYTLTPQAATPLGYGYSFLVPSEILRVITVSGNSRDLLNQIGDWVIEGNSDGSIILANHEVIYVRAVRQVTNTAYFSPMFVQCLAARMAMEFAVPLSNSPEQQARLKAEYVAKINIAKASDGRQGRSQKTRSNFISRKRRTNGVFSGGLL